MKTTDHRLRQIVREHGDFETKVKYAMLEGVKPTRCIVCRKERFLVDGAKCFECLHGPWFKARVDSSQNPQA